MSTSKLNASGTELARANFSALSRSQITRELLDTFHQATGWTLRLIPPHPAIQSPDIETPETRFCRLVKQRGGGRVACQVVHAGMLARVTKTTAPQHCNCFAQMAHVAWPVLVGKHHIATLVAGQVRVHDVGRNGITQIKRILRQKSAGRYLAQLERAWGQSPVVERAQFNGHVRLLGVLAEMLGECASRWLLASASDEPPAVQHAKQYVRSNLGKPISQRAVLGHVHLSPQYFCRLFKNTTGTTFTEYVWRVRVERAKELLHDEHRLIKQVAIVSGFQSVSHFDHVFRKLTGFSPNAYRVKTRQRKANSAAT